MKSHLSIPFLAFTAACVLSAHADWKQWRGPSGQGHADANLPLKWSETKNVEWRAELKGKGWSSPVIEGDQIWLTAAHEVEASEAEKAERLKSNTGSQPVVVLSLVKLHAICVDKNSGRLLHDVEILRKKNPQWSHKLNSYASPTPVIENGKLYCHFGSYGTVCVDTKKAKVVWKNQDLHVAHENGPGSTPVLWEDKLIFHMDGSDKQYIVALDKNTGKVAWKTDRSGEMNENPQLKKAYGTPIVLNVDGNPVVFSPAADWLYGYNPRNGKELWKLNYGALGFSIVPKPVAGHGMVYLSTSFMKPQLLAVKYEGVSKPEIAWSFKRNVSQQPSPILVGDEIYFVSDRAGMVTCVDALTGKELWRERIAGTYSSSPTHANGRIYFHSRTGDTTVLQAGKTFRKLAKNTLDGELMATAAVDGDALILRTDKALYRIEE